MGRTVLALLNFIYRIFFLYYSKIRQNEPIFKTFAIALAYSCKEFNFVFVAQFTLLYVSFGVSLRKDKNQEVAAESPHAREFEC